MTIAIMLHIAIIFTLVAFNLVKSLSLNRSLFSIYYHEAVPHQPTDRACCFNSSKEVESLLDEAFINSNFSNCYGSDSSGLVSVNAYDESGCLGNVVAVASKPLNTCLPALDHSSSAETTGSFIYTCSSGVVYIQHFPDLECTNTTSVVNKRLLTCENHGNVNEGLMFSSMRGFCDEEHSSISLPTPPLTPICEEVMKGKLAVDADLNIPPSELSALEDLYYATGGADWRWEKGPTAGAEWNFTGNPNPCSDNWQGLTCSTPSPGDTYKSTITLLLPSYNLQGSLPSSLGSLTELTVLDLDDNSLTGTIPSNLGSLTELTYLFLDSNALTGTIPSSLVSLTELIYLNMSSNALTGTIPSSFGSLPELAYLDLDENALTRTIPSSLGTLTGLTALDLSWNELTGTIPSSLGTLTGLTALDLSWNELTGTIPSNLGSLTNLTYLIILRNALTGTIPSKFGSLKELTALYLDYNALTGTIPSSIGSLNELIFLNLARNKLTGTIPSSLGSLTELTFLDLAINELTGAIPSSLGSLTELIFLDLARNKLTGTIPSSLGSLKVVTALALSFNTLTGTIPSNLGSPTILRKLYLEKNSLTGTISSSLASLTKLADLDLDSNFLSGTISSAFSKLPKLEFLSAHDNRLSGSLDGVFNSTLQTQLLEVVLYNNQLSGTVPVELFRLPALSAVALATNCFSGTLPQDMCGQEQLQSIILDGLHTATSCRNRIWALSEAYTVNGGIYGTIPSCVFSLPKLQLLHISGNGLTGKLPNGIQLSSKISQLTLSHNALTGPIPAEFQLHSWASVDLSYNLLSGTLNTEFGRNMINTSTVYVQNNRLSGEIPSYLVELRNVSALGSNMFSCKTEKSDLPQHDSNIDTYQCGSDAFDAPWYSFMVVVLVVWAIIMLMNIAPEQLRLLRSYWNLYSLPKSSLPYSCQQAYTMVEILCQVSVFSTIVILVVLVPWYATASHYWGTYTHSYAWVVSAAFISGLTPGVVVFFLLTAIVGTVVVLTVASVRNAAQTGGSLKSLHTFPSVQNKSCTATPRVLAMYAFVISINIIAVVGVNAAFVTATLKASSSVLTLVQILLSVFKYLWNSFYVRRIDNYISAISGVQNIGIGLFALRTWIGVFNNIIVPCLVVAVLSPSCFYSIYDTPQEVQSSYRSQSCVREKGCFRDAETVSYQPPFSYDYQCSSSFITYYAPTFVYLAITASLVTPALHLIILYLLSLIEGALLRRIIINSLPAILQPDPLNTNASDLTTKVLFDINNLLSALFMYLGVLLTFGVVFPPLAVAMCFTILSASWQIKLLVGRLIRNAREASDEQYQKVIRKVEEDCRGAASLEKLRIGMLLLIGSAFCFYALFVFDTVGDAEGFGGAYWVLIVMPLMTACLIVILLVRSYMTMSSDKEGKTESSFQQENEIELTHQGSASTRTGDTGDGVEVSAAAGRVPTNNTVDVNDSVTVSTMHQEQV